MFCTISIDYCPLQLADTRNMILKNEIEFLTFHTKAYYFK